MFEKKRRERQTEKIIKLVKKNYIRNERKGKQSLKRMKKKKVRKGLKIEKN